MTVPQKPAANETNPAAPSAADASVDPSASTNPSPPEEQMARYEDDLKETDWGHQPC